MDNNINRRTLLRNSAAVGAGLAMPTIFANNSWGATYLNEPKGATVTFGFNVPQTGAYADEGADELRAFELAVEHINGEGDGGMLNTFTSKALRGSGVNGKKVIFKTGDTRTNAKAAIASARRLIINENAIMISGGSSSGVAIAVQDFCQSAGVIFMAGLTHSNDTTGKDKRANGFRHFFNTEMTGAALAPVLKLAFGAERVAYHLTADYTWGWSQEGSIKKYTERLGWQTANTVRTPLGAGDFSEFITPVLASGADVLVLNHYGRDMVNSLTQAVQLGLRDKQVNGNDVQIVVPLFSRLMAVGAGENVKGIYGSTNWHWSLRDRGSKTLVKSFGKKYGFPPSQAAHTVYCQTILYADACQRARTFRPSAVGSALEGFKFDGLGNGKTEYRAEDHQCFKDILVVQGKEDPASIFDLLEVVKVTPRDQIQYPPSMLGGNLGKYNDGV